MNNPQETTDPRSKALMEYLEEGEQAPLLNKREKRSAARRLFGDKSKISGHHILEQHRAKIDWCMKEIQKLKGEPPDDG